MMLNCETVIMKPLNYDNIQGGGVYISGSSTVVHFTSCEISGNTAYYVSCRCPILSMAPMDDCIGSPAATSVRLSFNQSPNG